MQWPRRDLHGAIGASVACGLSTVPSTQYPAPLDMTTQTVRRAIPKNRTGGNGHVDPEG